jgi:hypothetical protein
MRRQTDGVDSSVAPEAHHPDVEDQEMTWIKHVPYEQADDDLKRVYESVRSLYPVEYAGPSVPSLVRPDGGSDSIVAAHSLIPAAMQHMMSGLGALLQPNLALTRRQQEMIASVVSVENSCFY